MIPIENSGESTGCDAAVLAFSRNRRFSLDSAAIHGFVGANCAIASVHEELCVESKVVLRRQVVGFLCRKNVHVRSMAEAQDIRIRQATRLHHSTEIEVYSHEH